MKFQKLKDKWNTFSEKVKIAIIFGAIIIVIIIVGLVTQ